MNKLKSWYRAIFKPDPYEGVRREMDMVMEVTRIISNADGRNVDLARLYSLLSQITLLDFVWVDHLMTPMEMACLKCNPWCLAALIAHGADVNGKERKNRERFLPLHEVCKNQESPWALDCVRMLVEKGADINATDEFGIQPIIFATMSGNAEVVEYLLKAGVDVDSKEKRNKVPPLAWASRIPPVEDDVQLDESEQPARDSQQQDDRQDTQDTTSGGRSEETSEARHLQDEHTQATSQVEDPQVTSQEEDPPVTSQEEDPPVTSQEEDPPVTSQEEGPKEASKEELSQAKSQEEHPQVTSGASEAMGGKDHASDQKIKRLSRTRVLRVLLEHGAEVNQMVHFHDCLSYAAGHLHIPRVLLLLAYGADINNPRRIHPHKCILKPVIQAASVKDDKKDKFLTMLYLLLAAGARITLESLQNELLPVLDSRLELAPIRDVVYHLLLDFAAGPLPLKMLCRLRIRSLLPPDIDANIQRCPVAATMQRYLRFEDIIIGGIIDE